MYLAFIIGTAGSGKSLLTASFSTWLSEQGVDVVKVNLDPGALYLPYTPDVDIRERIVVEEIMEEYGLGPNGSLILAADMMVNEIEELEEEIMSFHPDLVLVDTPGQMELFAFRASGPFIVKSLTKEPKAIVYLFDAVFSLNPLNYVSNLFLSAAVHIRFGIPQIHVLTKSDLLPKERLDEVLSWSEDVEALEEAIDSRLKGMSHALSRDLSMAIHSLELGFTLMAVSAKTFDGFLNLNAALERALSQGDKYVEAP